jgi:hypothetical protein
MNLNSYNLGNSKTTRAQTANSFFRLNSEFSFKDNIIDTNTNHNKSPDKKLGQTTSNFHLKIKVNKSQRGIQKVVDKYSDLKTSNINLNSLQRVNFSFYNFFIKFFIFS